MPARRNKESQPTSVSDFDARFPDDDACAQALTAEQGFVGIALYLILWALLAPVICIVNGLLRSLAGADP